MAVYVDWMRAKFGRMIMCHMLADSEAELLSMADRIGVSRRWYQRPGIERTSTPHFDICLSKKAKALAAGCLELKAGRDNDRLIEVIKKSRLWWAEKSKGRLSE